MSTAHKLEAGLPSDTTPPDESNFNIEMKVLLEAIFLKYHHDFRHYAHSSMKRRLKLAVERLGCRTLSSLQEKVLRDAAFFHQLLSYLTIPVSEMFRDPAFFRAVREHVVPYLRTYPSLKVWVAGCSTGEELYSLAIVLREEDLGERTLMYATDINPEALHQAQQGLYALDRMAQFSKSYLQAGGKGSLSDYYTARGHYALLDRTLRKNVVFSDHSLATDHVFSEVQLITCRNVLIYFDRELQERSVGLFHQSLCPMGFLGLGSKETLAFSEHESEFSVFSREQRIYQRR